MKYSRGSCTAEGPIAIATALAATARFEVVTVCEFLILPVLFGPWWRR
jgi:hypothetical protein